MSIRKEDIHRLVDLVSEHDAKLVYDLIRVIVEKDNEVVVEADNSPLTENEKKILKQADIDIKNGDLVDWNDLNA